MKIFNEIWKILITFITVLVSSFYIMILVEICKAETIDNDHVIAMCVSSLVIAFLINTTITVYQIKEEK